jgi:NADH-quinone oxidoreductase subunit N
VTFDLSQLMVAAPLFWVCLAGIVLLLLEAFATPDRQPGSRGFLMVLTVGACLVAGFLEYLAWNDANGAHSIFSGALYVDKMSIFLDVVVLAGCALAAMLAAPYLAQHRFEHGEFYALLLLGTAGMMMLGAASDLVTLFVGIETMSLAVYTLTGSWRRAPKSSEGAMKYFLMGAVASAILLYGIALMYGAVGSTSYKIIAERSVQAATQPIFLIGVILVVVGFGFKIAAVPFHMWAPDAYEGAPTPVTAFMAAGVKAAAFVAMIRLFGGPLNKPELAFGASGWASILSVLAIATMVFGNLAALRQENIKRMLAYSSIGHAGYLLIGVVALATIGPETRAPLLFYLASYAFTTLGSFGVVAWIGSRGEERLHLDDWAGLGQRHPGQALAMTIFMLSLGGLPPTAGFFGKFYLFRAALSKPGMLTLVLVAIATSLVSLAYYLRVVTTMYFREVGREPRPTQGRSMTAALLIAAIATMVIGCLPGWLLDAALKALP